MSPPQQFLYQVLSLGTDVPGSAIRSVAWPLLLKVTMELLRSVIEAVSMAFEAAGVLVLVGGTLAVLAAYVSGRVRGQPLPELYRGLRAGPGR